MLWTGGFDASWLAELIESENLNGLGWKGP